MQPAIHSSKPSTRCVSRVCGASGATLRGFRFVLGLSEVNVLAPSIAQKELWVSAVGCLPIGILYFDRLTLSRAEDSGKLHSSDGKLFLTYDKRSNVRRYKP